MIRDETDYGYLTDSPDMTATEDQAIGYLCRSDLIFEKRFFESMRRALYRVARSDTPISFTITLKPRERHERD